MELGEPEMFLGNIRKGNSEELLEITIPKKLVEFMGLEQGNKVRIWIKKIEEER